jgi:outer membrane protein OmpA-like peptidoglycan-associated protein
MSKALKVTIAATIAFVSSIPLQVRAAETPTASQLIEELTPPGGGAAPPASPVLTRGIRLGGQPPSVPKPGSDVSTNPAPAAAKPAEASLTVPFASGSSSISPAAARVLDQLGEALANPKLADYKFRVEGHTDTVGQPEANKQLSAQRAASVIEYLVTRHGIDRARLTPVGMGEEGLLIATGPRVANAANRRVLVVNLGK